MKGREKEKLSNYKEREGKEIKKNQILLPNNKE